MSYNKCLFEIWKPVRGHETLYEISNKGRVRSLMGWNGRRYVKRAKYLKPSKSTTGYMKVELVKDRVKKSFKVHRLVAQAFVDNPNDYPVVNHIDGNILNNDSSNLEWCTQAYNNQHAIDIGLRKKLCIDEKTLYRLHREERKTPREIADIYGVSRTPICRMLKEYGIYKRVTKYNLDDEDIKMRIARGDTMKEIADVYGCSWQLIGHKRSQIKKGEI